MTDWTVFDTMRDKGLERVWLRPVDGDWRRVGAVPDGEWSPLGELAPQLDWHLHEFARSLRVSPPQRIELVNRSDLGLRLVWVQHQPVSGRTLGAIRRMEFATPEKTLFDLAVRLARLATTRAWLSGAQCGGSALLMHGPAVPEYNVAPWVDAIAQEIELGGASLTVDSGFTVDLAKKLSARVGNVVGVRGGGSGATAAVGVHAAIRATAAALGKAPNETTVAIQGLGHAGAEIARLLAADGAKLVVTDRDLKAIDRFLEALPVLERKLVSVMAPYQILEVESDIFCPNAMANVIAADMVQALKCRAIVGVADAILVADGIEEEGRLAAQLFKRGILFIPDWLTGAGAAIHAVLEARMKDAFDGRAAAARTQRLCGWIVDEVLQASKRSSRSPFDVAVERFRIDGHGVPHVLPSL